MKENVIENFDRLLEKKTTSVAKDLKLNFKRLFEDSSLSEEEATLTLLATAKTLGIHQLQELAQSTLSKNGFSSEAIQEAEESAAIMGMLNIYYRFRHFIDHTSETAATDYGAAKLRMQSLANPVLGKEKFEMLAFAVSAINGCEKCVTSHEKALVHLGVSRDKIHDLARMAAVVTGLKQLL